MHLIIRYLRKYSLSVKGKETAVGHFGYVAESIIDSQHNTEQGT